MELSNLLNMIKSKGDKSFTIINQGNVALSAAAKKEGNTACKITFMPVVTGTTYAERPNIKKKISEGYVLSHELPWGQWSEVPEENNLIINHNDKKYLRVYPEGTCKSVYFLNDKEISYEDLKSCGLVNASYFNKKDEAPEVFTINIENILQII